MRADATRRLRTGPAGALTALVTVLGTVLATVLAGALAVPAAADDAGSAPGALTGYAFDARCAPTQAEMDAWLTTSPFWGVGIYLGGSSASCRPTLTDPGQPHLDATWVQRQTAQGWRLLPIWVGPQASCHPAYVDRIDPAPAASYAAADARGRAEAAAAVTRARELGLPAGSTLWYDLEGGFDVADDDCRRSALRFLSGWTLALHDLGYRSGVYSSVSAGIHALDNADSLSPGSYAMPDQVWYAWYNGRPDTDIDPRWVRADSWDGERVHQYGAQETATYGGVPLTIDRNVLDVGQGSVTPRERRYCGGTSLDLPTYPRLKTAQRPGRPGPKAEKRAAQVEALQCLLKRNGRYRGRLDGTFDRDVLRAVRSFQRHHDLRETGTVTAPTWVALLARGGTPLLKVGSADESVQRLQRALTAALSRRVRVTGVYTDATARAVARYQARAGLPETGVIADDTWDALLAGAR